MNIDKLYFSQEDLERIRTEISQQKQVEYHYIGSVKRMPGLRLYSFNTKTGEVKLAEMVFCKDVDFTTRLPLHRPKVTIEKDCIYIQALNKENVVKHIKRMINK